MTIAGVAAKVTRDAAPVPPPATLGAVHAPPLAVPPAASPPERFVTCAMRVVLAAVRVVFSASKVAILVIKVVLLACRFPLFC